MDQRFNIPPMWPQQPEGWTPPLGWQPDPSWPPAPEGWNFWVPVHPAFKPRELPHRNDVNAGEIISRTIFGGFWSVVTLAAIVSGCVALGAGKAGGMLLWLLAVPTGMYARYIFRGGRFRFLFW
jgi:hypothetical protein